MACDVNLKEGVPYKCHPNDHKQICKSKFCLLCGAVYHRSCLARKTHTEIDHIFIVCCEQEIISSKIGEKEDDINTLKKIIALQKYKLVETQKENSLLKKLNSEIDDKNKLLISMLEERRSQKVTYADILGAGGETKVPSILVKATDEGCEDIRIRVEERIQKDIKVPIQKVFAKRDGSVSVKCLKSNDVDKVKTLLVEGLGNQCNISIEKQANPRMKIVGIETNENNMELQADINQRNFCQDSDNCKILHTYENKFKKISAIIEVTAEAYTYIRNNNNYVYVGHQKCKVYDDLNVMPCANCGGYGHGKKKCRNNTACLICAGEHDTGVCTNKNNFKCINCIYSNQKYKTNRNVHHSIFDTTQCEILMSKINNMIAKTDYPNKPAVPKMIRNYSNERGKNEVVNRSQQQRMNQNQVSTEQQQSQHSSQPGRTSRNLTDR